MKWATWRWQTRACCDGHVWAGRHHAPGSHLTGSTRSGRPTSRWALDLGAASSPPPLHWSRHHCVWEDNMHHGQQRLVSSTSLKQQNASYPKLPILQLLHISLSLIQKARVLQFVGRNKSCHFPFQFSLQQLTSCVSSHSHHASVPDLDTTVSLKLPRPLHLRGTESQALPPTRSMVAY